MTKFLITAARRSLNKTFFTLCSDGNHLRPSYHTMLSRQRVTEGRRCALWSGLVLAICSTVLTRCSAFTALSRDHARSQLHRRLSSIQSNEKDPLFDTIMRFELKHELLRAADEFQVLQQREMIAKTAAEEEKYAKSRWFGRKGRHKERIGGELKMSVRNCYEIRLTIFKNCCCVARQVFMVLKVLRRLRLTWARREKR